MKRKIKTPTIVKNEEPIMFTAAVVELNNQKFTLLIVVPNTIKNDYVRNNLLKMFEHQFEDSKVILMEHISDGHILTTATEEETNLIINAKIQDDQFKDYEYKPAIDLLFERIFNMEESKV